MPRTNGKLHAQVFLHVSLTFRSVIKLELVDVTFPSAVVFGRLVRALPHLSPLKYSGVFLLVSLTFRSAIKLELFNVTFPSAVVFGRLVRALPHLFPLKYSGVRFKKGCHVACAVRVPGSLRLDAGDLVGSDDMFDFLVSIGAHLRHLTCHGYDMERHPELLAVSAESLLSLEVLFIHKASLDLTPAVNLRVLALAGYLEDIAKAAILLSCGSLPNIVEVAIGSWLFHLETPVNVDDALNSVHNDSFAAMDRILSGKQFPALQKVTCTLRCTVPSSSGAMNVISAGFWLTALIKASSIACQWPPLVS
ncbi:uncharacterized protein FIBRA_09297 [Fibroporia radiculosa]|uniref:Uncharacterized protein n=1 Tax=Fibroporia radiculosa TaxID=599839 RepID=J7RHC3_9APHY|nr:uncharacterized protein FIBRA_09297 [Fibroporia radiculosa]CCM06982.1 predicted protein [Fibroporia radiculosa]